MPQTGNAHSARDARSLPLRDHVLFASTDLDEARERVAAVFCPHRLETPGAARRQFAARHHHLAGQALSLNYIEYGARTVISPGCLERFYLVQIPLSGGAEICSGTDRYLTAPGTAAVLNPHMPTTMTWEAGTRQVLVQIDRQALQDLAQAEFGTAESAALTFVGPLDLLHGPGAALGRLVNFLLAEADAGAQPLAGGLLGRQIERAVLAGLLASHRHVQNPIPLRNHRPLRPRHLRLAEGYIEAHLDQPLTIDEIARAAGISTRGLQLAFREFRGTTPLAFWREMRLERAHADLIAGAGSVTEVALKWGFGHFGRFADLYCRRYGLTPRDSLRAGRPN